MSKALSPEYLWSRCQWSFTLQGYAEGGVRWKVGGRMWGRGQSRRQQKERKKWRWEWEKVEWEGWRLWRAWRWWRPPTQFGSWRKVFISLFFAMKLWHGRIEKIKLFPYWAGDWASSHTAVQSESNVIGGFRQQSCIQRSSKTCMHHHV